MHDADSEYWWYGPKCSVDDMVDKAAAMTTAELCATLSEMAGTSARISARVQDKSLDSDARGRARYALAHLSEKRKTLKSIVQELQQANEGKDDRKHRALDMLDHVDTIAERDPANAIRTLTAALRAFWNKEE